MKKANRDKLDTVRWCKRLEKLIAKMPPGVILRGGLGGLDIIDIADADSEDQGEIDGRSIDMHRRYLLGVTD